ncbi:methyltransferase domain-containing protein [candidate division KSB1 bacterium]|nr:methyltransferase domain-containing protein [candidate division KSB1 bacterium]NIR71340.1 methyltransferase domain-containing protein [candidate division KSB1 bacterium]NIS26230.1 methyltransferase domain-containing protein [candidate division KSB1 bacterium]NIT74660.1 methyltransferase domain-containing protein [candidate division KSB1 bacterium]NIU26878.1 methyltransferase domain-containing protein [candidate division KSB1 bacterium]
MKLTTPDIKKKENFREFYESVGRLYPEEELVYSSLRGRVRWKFVCSYLQTFHGRLLDLGCNRGAYLAGYEKGKPIGMDLAQSVLSFAKRRVPNACFMQCDAQNLCLQSGSIDSILCTEVIEHVPDARRVLAECFRVLNHGGSILITTPNYRGRKPTWTEVGIMEQYGVQGVNGDRYFHTAFRPDELKSMAETVGFRVLKSGTFEKEVKYATRIPVFFYHIFDRINRHTVKSERLEQMNGAVFQEWSLLIYKLCVALHLDGFFSRLVREGVRTFLFAQKPS